MVHLESQSRWGLLDRIGDGQGQGVLLGSGRLFWWAIWLVFLANPIGDIVAGRYNGGLALAAWLSLGIFAGLYLASGRNAFRRYVEAERARRLGPYVGLMVFTLLIAPMFGPTWAELTIYLGVATGATLGVAAAVPVLGLLAAYDLGWAATGASSLGSAGFGAFMTVALGASMMLIRQCAILIVDLREARADLARLAVDAERLRFARDLHDGLGHSISVIALQAQVARRVMTSDPAAASSALVEVERVSHESLAALREMVTGYRQPRLDDELAGARDVLAAAGIGVEIVRLDDPLPESSDRLLAWAVREGVTNVLRHSRAHACRIIIERDPGFWRLELSDDGVGGTGASNGSGVAGLRERMSAVGGDVSAGPAPGGGFRLSVQLPVRPA